MRDGLHLTDPRLLESTDEFGDDVTVQILSVFPNFVLQQIHNSVALRWCCRKGPNETELQWIYLGFEDDDAAMTERRLLQSNLVGPAGYVSMEDGAVGNFVQRAIVGSEDDALFGDRDGRARACLAGHPHHRSLDPRLLACLSPADGLLSG
jgi:anthranilate 1,2-dioxygenase large subunit